MIAGADIPIDDQQTGDDILVTQQSDEAYNPYYTQDTSCLQDLILTVA